MLSFLQSGLRWVEAGFNLAFTDRWNPWYQLGALSFFFFWIVTVSGIYLFIFFNTSIVGAYESVEYMTTEQWYLAGIMRSLHRYASDAMVIVVTLHLVRELVLGRFRGVRWFSWFSGVPLLWLLFAAGIGGYWLVWDRLAQYIAVSTSEWIDWLPVLGGGLSRNFISMQTLSDRFFSLLVFLHIAIPLFLLLGMFIHIKRIKLARSNPSRGLMVGTLGALIVLSVVKPAVSMGAADLSSTVARVDLDWFYLNMYPLLDSLGPGPLWLALAALTGLLAVLPWLSPERKTNETEAAVVDPANCNGCGWCFQDCPFEAITMIEHEYKTHRRQAQVNPDLCTACGICEGSCPSATPFRHVEELVSGIEIPAFPLDSLRQATEASVAGLGETPGLVLFGCDCALDISSLADEHLSVVSLPCTGSLPPSFADFVARKPQVAGVMVTGCHPEDCFFRKGSEWTEQRFNGERMPHLRTKDGKHKVRVCWAGPHRRAHLVAEIEAFRAEIAAAGLADGKPDEHAEEATA
jgi:quinol-cytochrome oxidoreductase complex cytochrome b subunit/coenzyme F420-reducing hydrogenase delta subunit